MCIIEECATQPCFNIKDEKKPLYCFEHKTEEMIDIKNKRCIFLGCLKQPIFNKVGKKKALYCSEHKKVGMIDIKHRTCIGCSKHPNFNIEGEKIALYCYEHKKEGMIDIKHKTCKSTWCFTRVQEKYDGYCLFCYMNLFPDKPVSRNYKTKEYSVVESVKNHFPDIDCITDKRVQNGCSKRRPDILIDLGYQVIIVEVDENQHVTYDCSCENKRLIELSQDLQHRPIIFIRFNPDDYELEGEKISSCWGNDKNGICVVKKSKKKEWEKRLETLNSQINYWLHNENVTDKTIEIIQLFY